MNNAQITNRMWFFLKVFPYPPIGPIPSPSPKAVAGRRLGLVRLQGGYQVANSCGKDDQESGDPGTGSPYPRHPKLEI